MPFPRLAALILLVLVQIAPALSQPNKPSSILPPGAKRVPVVFTGGYDTDPRDGGRPVKLIASALEVPEEVFRETFTHVRPAGPGQGVTDQRARENKSALMAGLKKYGVTNDRLDEVSNHYRYVRSRGELWTHKEAKANAIVRDGKILSYEIIDPGAGYSSPPQVTVEGIKDVPAVVELAYGKNLKTNGSITAIKLPSPNSR